MLRPGARPRRVPCRPTKRQRKPACSASAAGNSSNVKVWRQCVHGPLGLMPRLTTLPTARKVRPQHNGRALSFAFGLAISTRYPAAPSTASAASMFSRSIRIQPVRLERSLPMQNLTHLFSSRCSLRDARGLRLPRGGADQIRDPASGQPGSTGQDWLPAQASGRAASERGAPVSCQFHLSSGKLDQATPGDCQFSDRLYYFW